MKRYDIVNNGAEGAKEMFGGKLCRVIRKYNHKGLLIIESVAHNDLGFFSIERCGGQSGYWISNTACLADDVQVENMKINRNFFNIEKIFLTRRSAQEFLLEFLEGKVEFSNETAA